MAAAGLTPQIIVLALGAGALGFPDALRLLLVLAGRSPLLDVAACVLAVAAATAHVLGAMLLARFIRKARPGAGAGGPGPAPAADGFARMTLALSLGVAFLVFLCLLAAPGVGAGALGRVYLAVDFAGQGPTITAVLVVGAASLLCATGAGGAAPALAVGTRHFGVLTARVMLPALVSIALACLLVTMYPCAA